MEHIGSALGQLLKHSGLLEGIRRQRILKAWAEIVGADFAENSRPARISQETLWIEAANSSWAAQLMMIRREIVTRYDEKFGKLPFRDVRVTVGMFPHGPGGGRRAASKETDRGKGSG